MQPIPAGPSTVNTVGLYTFPWDDLVATHSTGFVYRLSPRIASGTLQQIRNDGASNDRRNSATKSTARKRAADGVKSPLPAAVEGQSTGVEAGKRPSTASPSSSTTASSAEGNSPGKNVRTRRNSNRTAPGEKLFADEGGCKFPGTYASAVPPFHFFPRRNNGAPVIRSLNCGFAESHLENCRYSVSPTVTPTSAATEREPEASADQQRRGSSGSSSLNSSYPSAYDELFDDCHSCRPFCLCMSQFDIDRSYALEIFSRDLLLEAQDYICHSMLPRYGGDSVFGDYDLAEILYRYYCLYTVTRLMRCASAGDVTDTFIPVLPKPVYNPETLFSYHLLERKSSVSLSVSGAAKSTKSSRWFSRSSSRSTTPLSFKEGHNSSRLTFRNTTLDTVIEVQSEAAAEPACTNLKGGWAVAGQQKAKVAFPRTISLNYLFPVGLSTASDDTKRRNFVIDATADAAAAPVRVAPGDSLNDKDRGRNKKVAKGSFSKKRSSLGIPRLGFERGNETHCELLEKYVGQLKWVKAADDDIECRIWYAQVPGSTEFYIRIDGLVKAPFMDVLAVMAEPDLANQWAPNLRFPFRMGVNKACTLLRDGRFDKLSYYNVDMPWPFQNRAAFMHGWVTDDLEKHGNIMLTYRSHNKPGESSLFSSMGNVHKSYADNTVVVRFDGGCITTLLDESSCFLRVFGLVDPRDKVPNVLLNFFCSTFLRVGFHNFKAKCAELGKDPTNDFAAARRRDRWLYGYLEKHIQELIAFGASPYRGPLEGKIKGKDKKGKRRKS